LTQQRKDLIIEQTRNPKPLPEFDADKLRFGANSTDHMLSIDHCTKTGLLIVFWLIQTLIKPFSCFLLGWSKPVIHEFRNLSVHPFNSAIHYALQCFEGAKAFKGTDGKIRMFRVHQNMFRFKNSCKALSLPVSQQ
jgi:branched-chain amino acid aminotransferase